MRGFWGWGNKAQSRVRLPKRLIDPIFKAVRYTPGGFFVGCGLKLQHMHSTAPTSSPGTTTALVVVLFALLATQPSVASADGCNPTLKNLIGGVAVSRLQLLPLGKFAATDGRPANLDLGYDRWTVDAEGVAAMQAARQRRGNDYVVDYEHQTLLAASNGQKAPAAGWFKNFELVTTGDKPGLWACDVQWTPQAAAEIASGQYKYVSAVFFVNSTGQVVELHSAALTNNPALDGMAAVALAAQSLVPAAVFSATPSPSTVSASLSPSLQSALKDESMKTVLTALSLAEVASEAQALSAVVALQRELTAAKANQFDAAKHIALSEYATLQGQLTALTAKADDAERAQLMDACIKDGRITLSAKDFWAKAPLVQLTEYAKIATPNPALAAGSQTAAAKQGGTTAVALTAEQERIAAACGVTPEQFAKAGPMGVRAEAE